MTDAGTEARASRFVEELVSILLRRGVAIDDAHRTAERLRPVYLETSRDYADRRHE